ncbi:hypothetical protein RF11_13490 [Thelohanellus kitauei]|uniref:Uncharacterized protein n=1 Tax=Thelohanellus kitauei TaxID=669202 RepID=A0A0C2J1F8_THEKT|nr:hypothetical protein RF11_13490 [Thelohanellus kitauei]
MYLSNIYVCRITNDIYSFPLFNVEHVLIKILTLKNPRSKIEETRADVCSSFRSGTASRKGRVPEGRSFTNALFIGNVSMCFFPANQCPFNIVALMGRGTRVNV